MSRLALVVSTAPELGDFDAVCELAAAARRANHAVEVFVMGAAVRNLVDGGERVDALVDGGCEVIACAASLHAAGLDDRALGAVVGSQDDHAAMLHRADRALAFT